MAGLKTKPNVIFVHLLIDSVIVCVFVLVNIY